MKNFLTAALTLISAVTFAASPPYQRMDVVTVGARRIQPRT